MVVVQSICSESGDWVAVEGGTWKSGRGGGSSREGGGRNDNEGLQCRLTLEIVTSGWQFRVAVEGGT